MKKAGVLITAVVIILCATLGFALKKPPHKAEAPIVIDTTGQPTLSSIKATAPVHVVVFEDLKCPVCAQYNNTIFPKIQSYIDKGTVQYHMITLAFIPGSIPAGNAALCLYQKNKDYFFPFVEQIYKNQPDETKNWATIPLLLKFAKQAIPTLTAVDENDLSQCIMAGKYTAQLAHNLKIAEKAMPNGVGTPAVFVNGHQVEPLTTDHLQEMIKKAEKK